MSEKEFKYWEDLLEREWLWLLDVDKNGYTSINWDEAKKKCNWNCLDCINTTIKDEIKKVKVRINWILCCKSHPETWEINEEGYCPEFDSKTWLCKIYNTDEYPEACRNYHCKTHWR